LDFGTGLLHFYLLTDQTIMKTQQTIISELRLVQRTKVNASEKLQVKCSKDAFDIFFDDCWDMIEHLQDDISDMISDADPEL